MLAFRTVTYCTENEETPTCAGPSPRAPKRRRAAPRRPLPCVVLPQFSVHPVAVSAPGPIKQEQTDFFRIKSFGGLAENAGKYLGKGSKVFVQGRIEPTKYEKDG